MIPANNPKLQSWVDVPTNSDFPIQNLPFGAGCVNGGQAEPLVAIGEKALRLRILAEAGLLQSVSIPVADYETKTLNALMRHGKSAMRALRERVSVLLQHDNTELQSKTDLCARALVDQNNIEMTMPVEVGDYTDFYSSIDHATNVGTMFRDPDNALLPNWRHLPVAYHGRASSIQITGTDIRRPCGQTKPKDADAPTYGPCKLLDFELEMAFVTFDGKPIGERISTAEAHDYIFGMVLFNDWSARDIQTWEYVPLGPFLAKNFASTISPWIVTLDALQPFTVAHPEQQPAVLPYLESDGPNYDIQLQVGITPEGGAETVVSNSNFQYMYWTVDQQLAHHTVNGCNIRCGDMMASGTISGAEQSSFGSMLEITWRGTKPVAMADGSERKFIADGDTVVMRGHAQANGVRVGFGEVRAKVLPANP